MNKLLFILLLSMVFIKPSIGQTQIILTSNQELNDLLDSYKVKDIYEKIIKYILIALSVIFKTKSNEKYFI